MVLPILGRAALFVGKKVAKNIAKKKKSKKKKETEAEELKRLENDPKNQAIDKALKDPNSILRKAFEKAMKDKASKKSRGGLAGRLAKRGYGKARK